MRIKPWPLPTILKIFVVLTVVKKIEADGHIGCLFSPTVCVPEVEWCYDDNLFGRCLQAAIEPDELYRYEYLSSEQLAIVANELQLLLEWNYHWSNQYTQCRLQALLFAFKNAIPFDGHGCRRFLPPGFEPLPQFSNIDDMDPLAIVRFSPSVSDPIAPFADEVYYPVEGQVIDYPDQLEVQKKTYPDDTDITFLPAMHRRREYEPVFGRDRPELLPSDFQEYVLTPEEFRAQQENIRDRIRLIQEDLANVDPPQEDLQESRIYYDDLDQNEAEDSLQNALVPQELENVIDPGIYTEGGVLFSPNSVSENKRMNNWGFKRHERLDVKKPGPPFDDKLIETKPVSRLIFKNDNTKKSLDTGTFDADMHMHSFLHHFNDDSSYAWVTLVNGIHTWNDGIQIIASLEKFLNLDDGTFSNQKVERNLLKFRVEPNSQGLNATDVATAIQERKEEIKNKINVNIDTAGVGYRIRQPVSPFHAEWIGNTEQELFVSKLLVGCVFAALLMAGVTLLLVWKHAVSRQKLQEINATIVDTEASKDYQELCRSRMFNKPAGGATPPCPQTQVMEKSEVHGRVTSLSKESEQQSPSSRSSTSSWSEEPVITNMDISTGHMVLSYMEDHLKNKDRLEQEWVALCAYEAEPCATTIAVLPENKDKNRYGHVLPYDHARVCLSSLTNLTESDYINASTITDHDPRNPAYIAAQGPLPNTAPDFWQMIWEQGSVVMVMLTRLTENGTAMCHRYWPEEGSEVYHIYEVHLVSEHIWCDDYLVRSFYLKNMKTGETRTVTQFHFLSWPELGVPTSTKALLEFRRKVNKSYRGRSCPIVVHCSDGAGRTGTYCLIDMVLNRMSKGAKEIDIAATLEHIRDQRPAMVTTKQQFEFVLMAVAEEVHAILKALPTTIEKSPQPPVAQQN